MKTTIPEGGDLRERTLFASREGSGPGFGIYEKEVETFSCVARGDIDGVTACLKELVDEKISFGGLDVGGLEEAKYRAVEIVNIAARYASQSCSEKQCLRIADLCVSEVDKEASTEGVYCILAERVLELTEFVRRSRQNHNYPLIIRESIDYINANLGRNLTVIDVARECRLSPDYLSAYFRKITGEKMTAYIRRQKLLLAREMLGAKMRCSETAKRLSFCSESYFVKCFREEFGVTPKKWQSSC